jgi:phospholipid/cholesterol/gamma-HCH transport system substrate-binding protein
LPSQHQLKWAQLRVGITVIFASVVLAALVFLMSGNIGPFSQKYVVRAYFENAGGLRVGAPVRLEGVDIGNIANIRLVPPEEQPPARVTSPPEQIPSSGRVDKPVEVTMKIGKKYVFDLHTDSIALLSTAGVLGETFVDIDSTDARGPKVGDRGAILRTRRMKTIEGVVSASQSTVENLDVLIRNLNRIVTDLQNGNGTFGKLLTDETLYSRLNATVRDFQTLVGQLSSGKGSVGKLLSSDELYNKLNSTVDKLSKVADDINSSNGTFGKFVKDPALYNNANQSIEKLNRMLDDRGSVLYKLTRDEKFAAKIDDAISKLTLIADRLEKGDGTFGELLKNPSVYTNTDQMLLETRHLVQAIRQDPKKYLTIHMKIF